jgi:hypothetical protein
MPSEAERQAPIRLGGIEQVKESMRGGDAGPSSARWCRTSAMPSVWDPCQKHGAPIDGLSAALAPP